VIPLEEKPKLPVKSYLELCLEIEILKSEIRILRAQKRDIEIQISNYKNPAAYTSPRHQRVKVDLKYSRAPKLEQLWQQYEEIEKAIEEKGRELKAFEYRKKSIDKLIENMDNLKYKIAVRREMQGKSLAEIADELGYSESHVKRISAEISQDLCYQDDTDK